MVVLRVGLVVTDAPLPSVRAVAVAFMRVIERSMTAAELRECRRRNARETSPYVCHTADHYDANMFMDEALEALGVSTDNIGSDQARTDLWNAAWDYAREKWLGGRASVIRRRRVSS